MEKEQTLRGREKEHLTTSTQQLFHCSRLRLPVFTALIKEATDSYRSTGPFPDSQGSYWIYLLQVTHQPHTT